MNLFRQIKAQLVERATNGALGLAQQVVRHFGLSLFSKHLALLPTLVRVVGMSFELVMQGEQLEWPVPEHAFRCWCPTERRKRRAPDALAQDCEKTGR
jgi:hypothetical protein